MIQRYTKTPLPSAQNVSWKLRVLSTHVRLCSALGDAAVLDRHSRMLLYMPLCQHASPHSTLRPHQRVRLVLNSSQVQSGEKLIKVILALHR